MCIPQHLRDIVRVSCPADITALAPHLMEDDREDMRELSGLSPEDALRHGLRASSPCVTFFPPGEPTVVMGMGGIVAPCLVWLLFHEDLFANATTRRIFLARCPEVRDWLLSLAPTGFLYNRTRAGSRRIRRWLRWLGACELPPTPDSVVSFYFQQSAGRSTCAPRWLSE